MCKHIFIAAHGSCFGGGNLSYHGNCKLCGIEMSMYGHIDDKENGEAFISTIDGKYKVHKKIKKGEII